MYASARTLRVDLRDVDHPPPHRSAREQERHDRILRLTRHLMVRHGRHAICMQSLAVALGVGGATLRRHLIDLDMFLSDLLLAHLRALAAAVGAVPPDAPECARQRRAAYHAYTHTALGGLTDLHQLLVRDRHTLPEADRAAIEEIRSAIGDSLGAGDYAYEALLLLDAPYIEPDRIEHMLRPSPPATVTTTAAAPEQARPAPPRLPPPQHRPEEPDAPGAWIYTAGIPRLSRAPPDPVLSG
jgi:AcrR family transcriptional regulator